MASLHFFFHHQEGRGSTREKTVPILVVDHSELFTMTKLLAIWFTAIFNHLSIKTKKSLENELRTIVCPEEFWHRKIPSFQKNYIGRSLIVPKQILIWIPHLVQDYNWKKKICEKKMNRVVYLYDICKKKIIVSYR